MADQTPGPWKDVHEQLERLGYEDGLLAELIAQARDSDRQQHQQTIQQQAETIRQLNDTVSRCAIDLLEKDRQIETLTQALKQADDAIVDGQACRSEAEFTRWMHRSQQARPTANLLAGASRPTPGEQA